MGGVMRVDILYSGCGNKDLVLVCVYWSSDIL